MGDALTTDSHQVGRYRLLERLAVGGMAEIFLASESGAHKFERLLVIKKMLPHLQQDQTFIEMFLQEARICARINHPNVVQIIELGEHQGLPFMAMEYVDGSTLRDLILATDKRRFHIPYGVVTHLMAQAMAGAHAVHVLNDAAGKSYRLVHRDISPHNLMVTVGGHVKLLDFGIVKAEGGEQTRTGVLKGKLSYMSPEQCHQGDVDARSDVYALGIVLWEMLAGEKLFAGKSELQVMQAIVSGKTRDLKQVRPDVPNAFVRVVNKALMLDREERYQSADKMRRDLIAAAQECFMESDSDTATDFVRDMLGDKHNSRQRQVASALSRTPVSEARLAPLDEERLATMTQTATRVTTYGVAGLMGFALSTGTIVLSLVILILGLIAYQFAPSSSGNNGNMHSYVVPIGTPVEVRYAPTIDEAILLAELEPFRRYLEQTMHQPVVFSVGKSYAETSSALTSGTVAFASLPPAIAMRTQTAHPDIELLAVKLLDGSVGTDGVLLVSEKSGIDTVADMKGKVLCFPDINSTTGFVLPRVYIRSHGVDPDVDMILAPPLGNHLNVIEAIVDGRCDVGGVYRGALDEASGKGIASARTRMIAMTGRTPHDAIAAGPSASAEQRAKLRQALLAMDPLKEFGVASLGDMEKLSGWVVPDTGAYDRLRDAVNEEDAIRAKANGDAP